MRKFIVATTVATLSFASLALAQSMGEDRRDQPAANSGALRTEAPTPRPSDRTLARPAPAHSPALDAARRKAAEQKMARIAPRISAAAQRGPEDFSADRMNHEELQKHMSVEGDGAPR
jgi:hypothetical protein